jgi:energy-coupling factor transporter ATP-binding protein EcfA2
MRKGDTVRSTGKGKTKSWGNYIGTVVRKRGNKVYVLWENTSIEDEMNLEEVELLKNIEEVTKLEFSDGMIIHTHGPLRVVEFSDGWYVVGEGKLIPVGSEVEGLRKITNLD